MKFKAETADLELELTTLGGDEIALSPKIVLNVKNVERTVKEWALLEKKRKKEHDDKEEVNFPFETIAIELSLVYDKPPEWWMEHFDISTLNEIMQFVAQGIANVKKKPGSSKLSSRSDTTESE